ncbi:glycosyltransferase family 2 protein [Microvirga sp. M2]|uniref:glycosyltransferase family 2 protein n=1 Tax=Microvirga sp. M2 TaxID=3073270 RepID=UPI0039C22DF1
MTDSEAAPPRDPSPYDLGRPSQSEAPLVSVVIPTLNRPQVVCRAVASVQSQTYQNIEILVVIDGHDPQTVENLVALNDNRIKVISHGRNMGPGPARNTGIRAAAGFWIAFLDDDDEWLPNKLELQVRAAQQLPRQENSIMTCRVYAEFGSNRAVWPARPPAESQHISEYLIDRPNLLARPGYVATPTIMLKRSLALRFPFQNDGDHEDWSWLLRLAHDAHAKLHFVWEPLVAVKISDTLTSRSHRNEWRVSYDWAQTYRAMMTRMAYASFLLTKVGAKARRVQDREAFLTILRSAFALGSPRLRHLAFFLGLWFIPLSAGHKLFTFSLKRS